MRSVHGRARRSELLRNRRDAGNSYSSPFASKLEEGDEVFLVPLERYVIALGRDGKAEDGEDYYRVEFKVDRNDVEAWARWTAWAVETFG